MTLLEKTFLVTITKKDTSSKVTCFTVYTDIVNSNEKGEKKDKYINIQIIILDKKTCLSRNKTHQFSTNDSQPWPLVPLQLSPS